MRLFKPQIPRNRVRTLKHVRGMVQRFITGSLLGMPGLVTGNRIFDAQCGSGKGFSPRASVLFTNYHFMNAHLSARAGMSM